MIASNSHSGITCEQAEHLFLFYLTNYSETAKEQEELLVDHLRICPICARQYKEVLLIVILIREYYAAKEEPAVFSSQPSGYFKTVDEVWENFKHRVPDFTDDAELQWLRHWLR